MTEKVPIWPSPISFADLQRVFGGSYPISLSEYYTDSTPGLTSGVTNIPTKNNPISLIMFSNKSKVDVPFPVPTMDFDDRFKNYTLPENSVYNTSNYVITGVKAVNLTRSGLSTFNNIGAETYNRQGNIIYNNLILQAKALDELEITVNTRCKDDSSLKQRIGIIAEGYNGSSFWSFSQYKTVSISPNLTDSTVSTIFSVTLSNSISPGNKMIMIFSTKINNNYDTSINMYSLQIFGIINSPPPLLAPSSLKRYNPDYSTSNIIVRQGNRENYALTGVKGENLTRKDVSTFNTIGEQTFYRPEVIFDYSKILQAKAGDFIRFTISTVGCLPTNGFITQEWRVRWGTPPLYVDGEAKLISFATYSTTTVQNTFAIYKIPINILRESYSICFLTTEYTYTSEGVINSMINSSENVYTLQIFEDGWPTSFQSNYALIAAAYIPPPVATIFPLLSEPPTQASRDSLASYSYHYFYPETINANTRNCVTTGAKGENLSRTGVSTFNNIGATTYGRKVHMHYPNLILQAKAGDTIKITYQIMGDKVTHYVGQTVHYYFGNGYKSAPTAQFGGSSTDDTVYTYFYGWPSNTTSTREWTYVIPLSIVPGNYAICCFTISELITINNITQVKETASFNYYSLHIYE